MNDPNHSKAGSDPSVAPAVDVGDPDAEPRPLEVDIVIDDDGWAVIDRVENAVADAAWAVASRSGLIERPSEATIALASDAEVAALNATYRGKPTPTNVLSFPASPPHPGHPKPDRHSLGDIILARETVLREAAEQHIVPVHHLQHLVVHGLLHLLGYDHQTDADAEIMEALEISILAGMSIPDPYAAGSLVSSPNLQITSKEP